MKEWRYYNHALLPTVAPHEMPDTSLLKESFKEEKRALFARWTKDFDCPEETEWWYVIKDTPFDLSSVKAKRRYEINKGLKNFDVKQIDPRDHREALWNVANAAFETYGDAYRPDVGKEEFMESIDTWTDYLVFAAFEKESAVIQGYAVIDDEESYFVFAVQKAMPKAEGRAVNRSLGLHHFG